MHILEPNDKSDDDVVVVVVVIVTAILRQRVTSECGGAHLCVFFFFSCGGFVLFLKQFFCFSVSHKALSTQTTQIINVFY